MYLLKACPRCHGDLVLDHERRTAYLYCVQCGHVVSEAEERALGVRAVWNGLIYLSSVEGEPQTSTRELAVPASSR